MHERVRSTTGKLSADCVAARHTKSAIEAGVRDYWRKYVGLDGAVVGIDTFGESAPAGELFEHFGFTVENVVDLVQRVLSLNKPTARAETGHRAAVE